MGRGRVNLKKRHVVRLLESEGLGDQDTALSRHMRLHVGVFIPSSIAVRARPPPLALRHKGARNTAFACSSLNCWCWCNGAESNICSCWLRPRQLSAGLALLFGIRQAIWHRFSGGGQWQCTGAWVKFFPLYLGWRQPTLGSLR
jgi:hypothetical protein